MTNQRHITPRFSQALSHTHHRRVGIITEYHVVHAIHTSYRRSAGHTNDGVSPNDTSTRRTGSCLFTKCCSVVLVMYDKVRETTQTLSETPC